MSNRKFVSVFMKSGSSKFLGAELLYNLVCHNVNQETFYFRSSFFYVSKQIDIITLDLRGQVRSKKQNQLQFPFLKFDM